MYKAIYHDTGEIEVLPFIGDASSFLEGVYNYTDSQNDDSGTFAVRPTPQEALTALKVSFEKRATHFQSQAALAYTTASNLNDALFKYPDI